MKPQRFEIGQAVTPNEGRLWALDLGNGKVIVGPRFGDIVHVYAYVWYEEYNEWAIILKEYAWITDGFRELRFSPVITTSELAEALEEINEPVKI